MSYSAQVTRGCSGPGFSLSRSVAISFDVYWSESGVDKVRYGVDGTISTNTLSLDGGSGDNFPESSHTGVVCTKQVPADEVLIVAANVQVLAMVLETTLTSARAHVDMQESDDTQVEHFTVKVVADGSAGKPNADHIYAVADGDANPLGADVAQIFASNGTTTAETLKILIGESL